MFVHLFYLFIYVAEKIFLCDYGLQNGKLKGIKKKKEMIKTALCFETIIHCDVQSCVVRLSFILITISWFRLGIFYYFVHGLRNCMHS